MSCITKPIYSLSWMMNGVNEVTQKYRDRNLNPLPQRNSFSGSDPFTSYVVNNYMFCSVWVQDEYKSKQKNLGPMSLLCWTARIISTYGRRKFSAYHKRIHRECLLVRLRTLHYQALFTNTACTENLTLAL